MNDKSNPSGIKSFLNRVLPLRSTGREEDSRRQYIIMGIFAAVCVVLGVAIDALAG